MIVIVANSIKEEIVRQIHEAKAYVAMMDETRDLSQLDQVIIVIRFVQKGTTKVQERMLGLVATHAKTGKALEELLLSVLENNKLDINNIVGQCYDGGANLSGVYEGVQARIRERNGNALFTHCYAHSLNRAIVNAMNHKSLPEPRSFFSILELLVVFLKGGNRLQYFLQARADLLQREGNTRDSTDITAEIADEPEVIAAEARAIGKTFLAENDKEERDDDDDDVTTCAASGQSRPLAPGNGICDTRWDARASTLHRYTKSTVLRAALQTVEHVIETTNDASARATAIGLKKSVTEPRFLLLLTAFRPVLEAVNTISKFLQNVQIYIGGAMARVDSLKSEIKHLRSNEAWEKARQEAQKLGVHVGVDLEEQLQAEAGNQLPRKMPRRIDERPETSVQLSLMEAFRTKHYFQALDKLISQLDTRFPNDLQDFKFLQPDNFFHIDAERAVTKLASQYRRHLDREKIVNEWRLFRHSDKILLGKSLAEVCSAIPDYYDDLRTLYKIFLTLPVTTSTLERGFSKLPLVKSKLRTTMTQPRLESLLLAAVERDITMALRDEQLAAKFAATKDRRMLLG